MPKYRTRLARQQATTALARREFSRSTKFAATRCPAQAAITAALWRTQSGPPGSSGPGCRKRLVRHDLQIYPMFLTIGSRARPEFLPVSDPVRPRRGQLEIRLRGLHNRGRGSPRGGVEGTYLTSNYGPRNTTLRSRMLERCDCTARSNRLHRRLLRSRSPQLRRGLV